MNAEQTTMPERNHSRGISGLNIALGAWVLISPFVLAFGGLRTAVWNNVIVGAAITVVALMRTTTRDNQADWSWINFVLAIWLILSPFLLGFTQSGAAVWNNIILGLVIAFMAWANARAHTRATA